MTAAPDITRRGGELLLRALEQDEPVIAAAAMGDLPSELLSTLLNSGAIERHIASRTILLADGDGTRFVDLIWNADCNAYGYFDGADGHVVLAPDAHAVFRINLPWWLRRLAANLDLNNATQPTEIVPNSAWDIGDLWITRQRKVPVLFARRLSRDAQFEALQAALAKRRGRGGGLILTSSRSPLRSSIEDPPYQVVPISEILTNDNDDFAIDRALAMSPYVPGAMRRGVTAPIHLSPDNRTLTIHGTISTFRGEIQLKIIRQLVDAFARGERLRTNQVLTKAGSSADSLAKAFHNSPNWRTLKTVLRQESGFCWLEN